jgi:hypothetical protein
MPVHTRQGMDTWEVISRQDGGGLPDQGAASRTSVGQRQRGGPGKPGRKAGIRRSRVPSPSQVGTEIETHGQQQKSPEMPGDPECRNVMVSNHPRHPDHAYSWEGDRGRLPRRRYQLLVICGKHVALGAVPEPVVWPPVLRRRSSLWQADHVPGDAL